MSQIAISNFVVDFIFERFFETIWDFE